MVRGGAGALGTEGEIGAGMAGGMERTGISISTATVSSVGSVLMLFGMTVLLNRSLLGFSKGEATVDGVGSFRATTWSLTFLK
jgi:hypothetical protein